MSCTGSRRMSEILWRTSVNPAAEWRRAGEICARFATVAPMTTQLKLFRSERTEPLSRRPADPAYIRKSLARLLRIAREAQIMPWSEAETESWEKLFPELAASLPADEGAELTSEFRSELARLRSIP